MNGLYKVLVVDDEMLIRQGIINYINWEEEGFQIVGEASNGREALQLIDQLQPHIVITDVVMPGMDGIELVRVVKEQHPSIEIVVLSSFENFDYVRSTFQHGVADYILKPKLNSEELVNTLRKIAPHPHSNSRKVQNSFSMEELLKKSTSGYSLTKNEEFLLEEFPYNYFSLLGICDLEKKENTFTAEEINNLFTDQINKSKTYLIPTNVSDIMVVLVNFDSVQLPFVKQCVINSSNQYRTSGGRTCWIMSSPFSTIHELQAVYEKSLLRMKDYAFYLSDKPVLIYDSLPEVRKSRKPFDLSRFIESFKQKKFEAAIDSLQDHVDYLTQNYTEDIFEFKSWMENIIFNIIVLLGNMKYEVDELETRKYEYFADINEAHHAKVAIECFHEFMEEVKSIVLAEHNMSHPSNMQRLLQYIENHYAEPLSLTTLADCFHFNPSYLSSYFSTHLNVGFSDYLNQVRIEKAKEYLGSTSASIGQVSEMVGYSEPSYFCKVFKRIEGASPGSYRKKSPAMN